MRRFRGVTLAELVVTLAIVGAVSTLVLPQLAHRAESSAATVTASSLAEVRTAVRNYIADMYERLPYPADPTRVQGPQLAYLFLNPATYGSGTGGSGEPAWTHDPVANRGWAGPYLLSGGRYAIDADAGFTTRYGKDGDPGAIDGWGRPIVLQQPATTAPGVYSAVSRRYARIVSAGPNGVIDTSPDALVPTSIGDDVVLALE